MEDYSVEDTLRNRQRELECRIADETVPQRIRDIATIRLMEVKYLSIVLGIYRKQVG